MTSIGFVEHDFSNLSVSQYRALASGCNVWEPNPFMAHPDGPWHEENFRRVVDGVTALFCRFDAGTVSEQQLLRGKDNDKRPGPTGLPLCHDTLSYWLYFQHHPISKRFGQNRPVPSLKTFPKGGGSGLVSEHVVPKKPMKELLLRARGRSKTESLLRLNSCCVVTGAEDERLERASHPNPFEPWQRYRGKGIIILHNPLWTDAEIEALLRNGLLSSRSIAPLCSG